MTIENEMQTVLFNFSVEIDYLTNVCEIARFFLAIIIRNAKHIKYNKAINIIPFKVMNQSNDILTDADSINHTIEIL